MASDEGKIFGYSVFGFFAGIFLFIKGFQWLKQKRMIENTPTSKIRSIAMGPVEVNGSVSASEQGILKGPFTGQDCVYYKYKIEEYRRSGKNSHWVTIKKGEESRPFYVQDNTGKVLVDPKGANIDIPKDYFSQSSIGKSPERVVSVFLKANNMKASFFGINKNMRYTEYNIAPSDKLYVLGTAGDNPFVEEATAQQGVEDVMIAKGPKRNFYYISDKPEKDLIKKFKWKVITGLFGGATLTVGCLTVILLYLRLL